MFGQGNSGQKTLDREGWYEEAVPAVFAKTWRCVLNFFPVYFPRNLQCKAKQNSERKQWGCMMHLRGWMGGGRLLGLVAAVTQRRDGCATAYIETQSKWNKTSKQP